MASSRLNGGSGFLVVSPFDFTLQRRIQWNVMHMQALFFTRLGPKHCSSQVLGRLTSSKIIWKWFEASLMNFCSSTTSFLLLQPSPVWGRNLDEVTWCDGRPYQALLRVALVISEAVDNAQECDFSLEFLKTWKPLSKILGIPRDAIYIYFLGFDAGRICIELLCRKKMLQVFNHVSA